MMRKMIDFVAAQNIKAFQRHWEEKPEEIEDKEQKALEVLQDSQAEGDAQVADVPVEVTLTHGAAFKLPDVLPVPVVRTGPETNAVIFVTDHHVLS